MGSFKKKFTVTAVLVFTSGLLLAFSPESFVVRLSGFKPEIYSKKVSRYRLKINNGSWSFPVYVNQRMIRKSTEWIILETGDFIRNQLSVNDRNIYLEDTPFLRLTDKAIKDSAKRLSSKKDPLRAVEFFVYKHIDKKQTGIPLLPADRIFRLSAGDCTEHSVLAVALLRSMGIPSRAVVGMILSQNFMGMTNVFVYHMWVEAFYKGKWHLIDATRPGEIYHNRYIAFTCHSLRSETPLSYLRAITTLQKIEVEYLSSD